jgi:hypothetical protein
LFDPRFLIGFRFDQTVRHPGSRTIKTESTMNKLAHGIVLVFLGTACFFVWALLQLPLQVRASGVTAPLPGFTKFCMEAGPFFLGGLLALATGYCLWVWFRKASAQLSWVGFLATTTASLFVLTLPVVVAIYLPLTRMFNTLPVK